MSYSILLDVGATGLDDCSARILLEFGILAVHYAKQRGIETPSLGLLCNGAEREKGTLMLRDANRLYELYSRDNSSFVYKGFVEGREIFYGDSSKPDIIVTDGFTGNICLKMMEGEALMLKYAIKRSFESSTVNKIVGLLAKYSGVFGKLKDFINPDKHGGACFLGLEHPFIKSHGASNTDAMKSALDSAYCTLSYTNGNQLRSDLEKASLLI